MLDRFKLTHRVLAALGLFWVVFGLLAAVGFNGMKHARDSMENIHDVRMRAADALATMTRSYQENRIQILMAFQHDPESPLARYHDHPIDLHFTNINRTREENNAASRIVEERDVDAEERAAIEDMLRRRSDWQRKRDVVMDEIKQGNFTPTVMAAFLGAVKIEGVAFEKTLTDLRALQSERADQETRAAQERYDQSKWIFALAILLGALPVTLVLHQVLWRLSRGLRAAGDTAAAIAANDLTHDIRYTGQDEIADLMLQLRTMEDNLRNLLGTVMSGAETIASASHQVAAGSHDLSSRTERQAASLEETASATEQLQSTVALNADNAQKADEMSREAFDVAAKGGQMVEQVVHTMNEIHASSQKVADIISVIDSIAFQTNILALNAAVEAARAGDLGRGFAVVAAEVRQLAQRSAAAAKEIKDLIGDSVRKVESGTVQVGETGTTMQEIVKSVKRVTQIMREIASSSAEQAQGINQISDALSTMDGVTQENAALVEQSSAASSALSHQSDKLKLAVCTFKI